MAFRSAWQSSQMPRSRSRSGVDVGFRSRVICAGVIAPVDRRLSDKTPAISTGTKAAVLSPSRPSRASPDFALDALDHPVQGWESKQSKPKDARFRVCARPPPVDRWHAGQRGESRGFTWPHAW
jgi:hypothetical protein